MTEERTIITLKMDETNHMEKGDSVAVDGKVWNISHFSPGGAFHEHIEFVQKENNWVNHKVASLGLYTHVHLIRATNDNGN